MTRSGFTISASGPLGKRSLPQASSCRRLRRLAVLGVALTAGVAGLTGCSETVRTGQSPAYLILERIDAAAGGTTSQTFTGVLRSDVLTKGGVFEDNGRVVLSIALKDVTNPTGPTTNNFITLNRYRVDFRRTDGRNTQGVDVPYAFEGAIAMTVTDQQTQGVFSLVRAQAKVEQPLITLRGGGGALVISTIADVTFFGRDQTGRDVTVTGSISVNFADWADPD
jgi:hypothetical protein